jgi:hypothetical protein
MTKPPPLFRCGLHRDRPEKRFGLDRPRDGDEGGEQRRNEVDAEGHFGDYGNPDPGSFEWNVPARGHSVFDPVKTERTKTTRKRAAASHPKRMPLSLAAVVRPTEAKDSLLPCVP